MRRLVWAALLAGTAQAWAAPGFAIGDLMRLLAAVPQSHAAFQEDRTIAQLTGPVHDSGTLDYVRPDRLDKHTLEPKEERLVVQGEHLWIERAGQPTRNFDLGSQPEISALVDTIRGTLAGDLAVLQKNYDVTLEGTAAAWRLTLVPSDAGLARFLRAVHIAGSGDRVELVETQESSGNSSRMTITPQ